MNTKQISMDDLEGMQVFQNYPAYDSELLKGIKGLHEIFEKLPHYLVTFKHPVFGGWTSKICIYLGYWHSWDGWNYKKHEAKEWRKVEWKKGMKYRWQD